MPLNLDGFLTKFNAQMNAQDQLQRQALQQRQSQIKTQLTPKKTVSSSEKNSFLGQLHLTPNTYKTNPVYTGLENFFNTASTLGARFDNQLTGTLLPKTNAKANEAQAKLIASQLKKNPNDAIAQSNAKVFNDAIVKKATTPVEKVTNLAGGFAGNTLPYVIGDGLLGMAGKGVGAVVKGTQFVNNPLAKLAINGAASGVMGSGVDMSAKHYIDGQNYTPGQIATNLGINAGAGAVLAPAAHTVLTNLNLKGQVGKLNKGLSYQPFNEADFQKALQDAYGQKGDVSNVLADVSKPTPTPYVPKIAPKPKTMNDFVPNEIPKVDVPATTDQWFNFAQSGKTPQARGSAPTANVGRFTKELIGNKGDNILNQVDALKNAPNGGYNQRLLNVQKDMQIAGDKRGIYRQSLSPDELYAKVKQPNDPATFDELIKLAEMENNVNTAPKNLKKMLHSDPNVKSALQQLNALGGTKKPFQMPTPNIPTVPSYEELMNSLPKAEAPKTITPNGMNLKLPNVKGTGNDSLQQFINAQKKSTVAIEPKGKGYTNISSAPEKGYTNISSSPAKLNDITAPNPQDGHGYGLIDLQAEANSKAISKDLEKEIQNIKDIGQFQVGTLNPYEIANRLPKEMGDTIKNSLDTAKKNYITHLETITNDLYDNVVKKLGIKSGSKDSALVQDYGEKTLVKKFLRKKGIDPATLSNEEIAKINLEQLKKVHPDKWQKIVEADKYFREQYNKLIDQVNAVRQQIYPTNPDKIVPKRNDYYHHFNELTGFEGVKNLFDTPANIDPHLEGISPYTTPKSKFQGFMQKRMNGTYKSDAVGGFLKYIKAASHSINVDPVIPVFRNTAKTLADATEQTRNANKIIEALNDHANDIAGKTNPYDRLLQKLIGRKTFRIINAANSRVKSNMIVGNLASTLGQIGNVPLGIAKAKQFVAPGLADTLTQVAQSALSKVNLAEKDLTAPIYQSNFLKERYSDQLFRRFDQKLIQQPKKLALWMMETADKSGTNFIWNSMYRKGLSEGVADPIKFADTETRSIVAGRGVGEVPLIQKARTTQIFAPFTLEVGNQWKVLRKMAGDKDAAGLLTFLVASYGLNKAMEAIRGSGVSFDPVGAFQQGYTRQNGTTKDKALHGAASVLGEVVGNIPGGNLLTGQVNTNNKIPLTNVKIKDLFGERDPNRFGSGLTVTKLVSDPLYLLPFGAAQIEKTYKGVNTIRKDGVYGGSNKSQLQFPVKQNLLKDLQLATMGPNSTSEGRTYFGNNQRPLSEKQTQIYNDIKAQGGKADLYYKDVMSQRQVTTLTKQIKSIDEDKTLTFEQKRSKILPLLDKLDKLQK